MEWRRLSDGVLQAQERGLSLELDPSRRNLCISVVDYHARPVDVSVTELHGLLPPATHPPQPHPLVAEDRRTRLLRLLKRSVPALLVGVVVGAVAVYASMCGCGEDE